MMTALYTICFAAIGFMLVTQHYRIQHLEIWRDNHVRKTHGND